MLAHYIALAGTVDPAAGTILGVSVITVGEAKGHNLQIDETTLQQVLAAAQKFENGVKVKIDHKTGFKGIVGSIRNFRIEPAAAYVNPPAGAGFSADRGTSRAAQLKGDLHLLKSHDAYATVLELSQTIPDTFGLSIAFSGKPEKKAGVKFARCQELYSIDLVDQPAANPNGLFSQTQPLDSPTPLMNGTFLSLVKSFFSTEEGKQIAAEALAPADMIPKSAFDLLTSQHATEKARADKATTDLATANATITEFKTAVEAFKSDLGAHKTFKEALDHGLTQELSKMGLKKPAAVAPDKTQAGTKTPTIVEQFFAIADPKDRAAFYRLHEKEILGS